MLDEGFFLTIAGLAMSFAGFAGLMNALRRRGETWEPMELYQLRIIVAYAIATLFGSVLVVPFVELFGQHDGVQWLGALMLIALVGTVITGAPALYRLALILMLAMPAGTFVYVVARINR